MDTNRVKLILELLEDNNIDSDKAFTLLLPDLKEMEDSISFQNPPIAYYQGSMDNRISIKYSCPCMPENGGSGNCNCILGMNQQTFA